MLVTTTVGSMLNDCTSTGMISENKRYEITHKLPKGVKLSPPVKIQTFERCTGYYVSVDSYLLERQRYGTRIIISDGMDGDIIPVEQKQSKSNCNSIW